MFGLYQMLQIYSGFIWNIWNTYFVMYNKQTKNNESSKYRNSNLWGWINLISLQRLLETLRSCASKISLAFFNFKNGLKLENILSAFYQFIPISKSYHSCIICNWNFIRYLDMNTFSKHLLLDASIKSFIASIF